MSKQISRHVLRALKKQLREPVHRCFLSSEWALKKWLKWAGGKFPPSVPERGWMNSTLKSREQLSEALAEARACGLPFPPPQKTWDAMSAVKCVLERTTPHAAVLDAGAALRSMPLLWLYLYGYRDLRGINLDLRGVIHKGPITYEHGDLTQTRFENQSFDVVLCMSVIEHGVDTQKYFREMARIIRPSGLLITSTDYWAEPIDTRGLSAFGAPVKIFTRPEVEMMIETARRYGFNTDGDIDLECREKAVFWQRFDLHFTSCCFCLTKAESS